MQMKENERLVHNVNCSDNAYTAVDADAEKLLKAEIAEIAETAEIYLDRGPNMLQHKLFKVNDIFNILHGLVY